LLSDKPPVSLELLVYSFEVWLFIYPVLTMANLERELQVHYVKGSMSKTRPCDFYLVVNDACVFLDFALNHKDGTAHMVRASFDGYGCMNLEKKPVPLLSASQVEGLVSGNADGRQGILKSYCKILQSMTPIWEDAFKEYGLIE
jgi:hypothetical protein